MSEHDDQRALDAGTSKEKDLAEALRRSEERYRVLVESQGEGIGIVDEKECFVFANAAAERIFGVAQGALVGRCLRDFIDEAEYEQILQQTGRRRSGSRDAYEMSFTRQSDGERRMLLVTATPRFDSEGQYGGAFGVFRDITQRKQAEEALRESEERYRQLIESLPHGVGIIQHGKIVFANQATARILRCADSEALKRRDPDRWLVEEERPRIGAMVKRLLAGEVEGPLHYFTRVQGSDGSQTPVEVFVSIVTHLGEPALQLYFVDISERLEADDARTRLEAQLIEARKLESIGRLAGGIAHEFNNLLTPVVINTNMALKESDPTDPRRQDFEDILEAAGRAKTLTRQLLAFGRRQLLQTKLLDINELIEEWNRTLRRLIREDVEVRLQLTRPLELVEADPAQIQQVLFNLVLNARDSMPAGGAIHVVTTCEEVEEEKSSPDLPAGRFVVLAVKDTGQGMDPGTVRQVFDPFYSTKEPGQGTGLGLATVHGIVKQHGGHVTVESRPGKGSLFRVFLPARQEQIVHSPLTGQPRRAVDPQAEFDQTVLVVEDEELLRRQVCRILARSGMTVLEASSGRQALELASSYEGTIDLLLTDVVMPQMNGEQLQREFRELRPELQVVFMSGYPDAALARNGEKQPMVLEKPFTLQSLIDAVREVLVDRVEDS